MNVRDVPEGVDEVEVEPARIRVKVDVPVGYIDLIQINEPVKPFLPFLFVSNRD